MNAAKSYKCFKCSKQFSKHNNFHVHIKTCSSKGKFVCPYCGCRNSRKDNMIRRHMVDQHPEKLVEVKSNPGLIKFAEDLSTLRPSKHKTITMTPFEKTFAKEEKEIMEWDRFPSLLWH